MTCEICGEPLTASAKFCSHCDNAVGMRATVSKRDGERPDTRLIKCPDCAHMVSDDAIACPSCGKIIGRPALERMRREAAREAARREQELDASLERDSRPIRPYIGAAVLIMLLGYLIGFVWLCGLGGTLLQFLLTIILSTVVGLAILAVGMIKHPAASRASNIAADRRKQQKKAGTMGPK